MNSFKSINPIFAVAWSSTRSQDPIASRDGNCYETIGSGFRLTDVARNVVTIPDRRLAPYYGPAELLWYLSGEREVTRLLPYAPSYKRFLDNGVAYGAYGYRLTSNPGFLAQRNRLDRTGAAKFFGEQEDWADNAKSLLLPGLCADQLQTALLTLYRRPESRQAVVTFWDSGDLLHACAADKKDLPCTLSAQLLIRDDKLHWITTMRSNDVYLGLPYDIYCFTSMQTLCAHALNLEPGDYVHNVGSLHTYARDADRDMNLSWDEYPVKPYVNPKMKVGTYIRRALEAEERVRTKGVLDVSALPPNTLLRDVVLACALNFGHNTQNDIHNAGLRTVAQAWKDRIHANR